MDKKADHNRRSVLPELPNAGRPIRLGPDQNRWLSSNDDAAMGGQITDTGGLQASDQYGW